MPVPSLGQLETVDAREVWKHEALDFTPWLREHIDLLGKALGLELEISESEAPVGAFAVDLLGQDVSNSRPLIIENQLEQTNHAHLGQLLTYAAGYEAGAIVWITPDFRDEHRQALDWLNAHTGEGIDFFGVVIELLTIKDTAGNQSPPAPHFKLVAQPNEWAKTTRTVSATARAEPTERGIRYQQFFQDLVDETKRLRPSATRSSKVGTASYCFWVGVKGGFSFWWSFTKGKGLRVELYIDTGNTARNKGLFDALNAQRKEVEDNLGIQLQWERLDGGKASRVAAYHPGAGSIDDSPEHLRELRVWAASTMLKVVEVFQPILQHVLD